MIYCISMCVLVIIHPRYNYVALLKKCIYVYDCVKQSVQIRQITYLNISVGSVLRQLLLRFRSVNERSPPAREPVTIHSDHSQKELSHSTIPISYHQRTYHRNTVVRTRAKASIQYKDVRTSISISIKIGASLGHC